MSKARSLRDDVAKILGQPPYDHDDNPYRGNTIFHAGCQRYWGKRAWIDAINTTRLAPRRPAKTASPPPPDQANTGTEAELEALRNMAAALLDRLERLQRSSQPVYRLLLRDPCGGASDLFMALDDVYKATTASRQT